jgi:hypothetical protein
MKRKREGVGVVEVDKEDKARELGMILGQALATLV